jgi:curved DNA-binding protein CbpA
MNKTNNTLEKAEEKFKQIEEARSLIEDLSMRLCWAQIGRAHV